MTNEGRVEIMELMKCWQKFQAEEFRRVVELGLRRSYG